MTKQDIQFMQRAIQWAQKGVEAPGGGPFGAVIVKDGEIIAEGHNLVVGTNDPTAHAEMVVIREACQKLNSYQLEGCIIYTSTEPCPMCFGAIYWSRPDKVFYACDNWDAAQAGFDDRFIYKELEKPMEDRKIPFEQIMREEGVKVFEEWGRKDDRPTY
ncbi:nucleoside deaminase [Algivirga pacifica]|uniref:Guanine deaminase n=1 Tax=Algivirga pacifica TaxID=1162670 RepID=A0ABP9D548_9BACT